MPDLSNAETDRNNTDPQANNDLLQLVSFDVGTEQYAFPILAIQEINRAIEIIPVTQSPTLIEGVFNLRGNLVPVVDLRKRFGMPIQENTGDERIIIAEIQGENETRVIGLAVDRVNRVLRISRDAVQPASPCVIGPDSDSVLGVSNLEEGHLTLLSLDKLFSQHELELAVSAIAKPHHGTSAEAA